MDIVEKWAFVVTWHDVNASLTREYTLTYYPASHEVDMIDNKSRRIFLKRTKTQALSSDILFIGSSFNLLGRQLTIQSFANEFTRNALETSRGHAVVLINDQGLAQLGSILQTICFKGSLLINAQMFRVTAPALSALEQCFANVQQGMAVAVEISGENALQAAAQASQTFGLETSVTSSAESTAQAVALCFGSHRFPTTAKLSNTTLGLIKPHAVANGSVGGIINAILQTGFQITALYSATLNRANAEEFLEVYKGVVPEYVSMVTELESGVCIAIEIEGDGANVQPDFRAICGPMDPEIARHLRPKTIRALYGATKVQNAIHCTDLADDTALEVEYFFDILLN